MCVCGWEAQVSVHLRARVQLIKMGWCQCTISFGWTVHLAPHKPFQYEGRFQANLTQHQDEEKDCEVRPNLPWLKRAREKQSHPSPRRWMPWISIMN